MSVDLVVTFIPIFISVVLHEVAHGCAALGFGDDTAKRYGRLSLNPIDHVDFVGTLLLPLVLWWGKAPFLFGWAKPVPVNFERLRNKKIGTVVVASAGIAVNAVLAIGAAMVIDNIDLGVYSEMFFTNLLLINLVLIFLNILPFPPLDGSKIFFGWMESDWAKKYVRAERNGLIVLVLLVAVVPLIGVLLGIKEIKIFNPLEWYMQAMFDWVMRVL